MLYNRTFLHVIDMHNQSNRELRLILDGTAGELVSPDKPRTQVDIESETGRELYRKTHFDYLVGEQCNRNYTTPSYNRTDKFGIPTPHDNAGKHVKRTLKWLHDTQSEKAALDGWMDLTSDPWEPIGALTPVC